MRKQPYFMPQPRQLARPMMRSAASLQRHHAARLASEKLQDLPTHDPTTEQLPPLRIRSMRVKYLLCDIQTYRANLTHGRLPIRCSTTPPWYIDTVGGRPPHLYCSSGIPLDWY